MRSVSFNGAEVGGRLRKFGGNKRDCARAKVLFLFLPFVDFLRDEQTS